MGKFRAGKCDACGGSLVLIQNEGEKRHIMGHLDECRVKNSEESFIPTAFNKKEIKQIIKEYG